MKITKKQLKKIIKEELSLIIEASDWYSDEHETLADKKYADSKEESYAVKRVGADEYFVKFVNKGEGDYETVFGSYDQAWTTDDEDRAGYMAGIVTQRTGFQTTIEPVASV